MINPYFTFTTDNENLCCYKTSAILNVNFYIDQNKKYKIQVQTSGDTTLDTIGTYTFKNKEFWLAAQDKWMDIMRAARNEGFNDTNMKYYGDSLGVIDPW